MKVGLQGTADTGRVLVELVGKSIDRPQTQATQYCSSGRHSCCPAGIHGGHCLYPPSSRLFSRGEGRGVVGCGHVMKEGKLNGEDENGSRTKVCVD
jgi:hypothetical protein